VKGKTSTEAAGLVEQARAVEAAGAFAVVLELVQADIAAQISEMLRIPTIGIGSGAGCDGQVLVIHDLIGLFPWFRPRFAKPEADVAREIRAAVGAFRGRIQTPVQPEAGPSQLGECYSQIRLVRRRTCRECVRTPLTHR